MRRRELRCGNNWKLGESETSSAVPPPTYSLTQELSHCSGGLRAKGLFLVFQESGGQALWTGAGGWSRSLEADPCLELNTLASPQTGTARGLGRSRLNTIRLSSKNGTIQIRASHDGPIPEGARGF